MTSEGHAKGKVILLGEHAVVYGQPALACAIPVGVRVRVRVGGSPASEPVRVVSPATGLTVCMGQAPESAAAACLLTAVERALMLLDAPKVGAEIEICSELPMGRGMGSSASLSIALLRAVAQWTGQKVSPERFLSMGLELERVFHGNPSGLDHATVLSEGLLVFSKGGRREPVYNRCGLDLVLLDSGGERQTLAMVQRVRERLEADPERMGRVIESVGEGVEGGIQALHAGDPVAFGQLMNQNQRLLEHLGVSTPRLEALIGGAQEAGALGAKLSGAGGGGVVVCLCDDASRAHHSSNILELAAKEGVSALAVHIPARSTVVSEETS